MILLLASIGVIIYIVLYYQHVRKYPKGPLPLPLIGNLYHLNPENLHEYLHETGKDYGHCFTLFLPRPVVMFTNFSTIKDSLVTQGDNFAGRSHLPPEVYLQKKDQTGVLISDGEVWREQRRASLRIMRELGLGKNLMEAQVNRSIDEMLHQLKETNDGVKPIDMNMPIQLCVGNIINETLFGFHFKHSDTAKFEFFLDCVNKHLTNMKDNFWVLLIQAWPWAKNLPIIRQKGYTEPIANISKYQAFIEDEVNKIAKEFNTHQEPTNFVQYYLAEMDKNKQLDLTNLYAIVIDFWIAGMETTSTTLRWALLFLMKHNHVQDKMRSEILSVVGKDRRIEMADKPKLPYFNAAITEIQRCANMIPFPLIHRCTEDSVIGGKLIPKDTLTLPQVFSVLKDDELFVNPSEFKPERFLEEDGRTANKKVLERFVAFGMGKRQCVGEGLARMELFLVLGTLLLNYRFEPIEPVDLTHIFGSTLIPRPYKCRSIFAVDSHPYHSRCGLFFVPPNRERDHSKEERVCQQYEIMGKKVIAEGVTLVGKIAVVTGANSGIGVETAKELNLRGAKVYMLCRSEERANEAKRKIVEAGCDPSRLIFSQCDLSKFDSVRKCGARMNEAESHIDILINNAGIMFYPQFELTENGHEMTWQSNHLGPFLLTELLLPLVKNAEEGRIVCLSSAMHLKQSGPIDLSTVDDKSSFSRFAPYNRSKLANVMHARELTRRFAESGVKNVTANSLHPGVIATDLSRHLPFPATWTKALKGLFLKSEEEGAYTTLFLAMAKEMKGVSGGYYADCARAKENKAALDDDACKKLYEYSKTAVGLD